MEDIAPYVDVYRLLVMPFAHIFQKGEVRKLPEDFVNTCIDIKEQFINARLDNSSNPTILFSERAKLFEQDKTKISEIASKQFDNDPLIKKTADASKIDIISRNVTSPYFISLNLWFLWSFVFFV